MKKIRMNHEVFVTNSGPHKTTDTDYTMRGDKCKFY